MVKKIIVIVLMVGLSVFLFVGAVNRTLAKSGSTAGEGVNHQGNSSRYGQSASVSIDTGEAGQGRRGGRRNSTAQGVDSTIVPPPDQAGLSAEEIDRVLFMYAEEKLARDVYTKLDETWRVQIFQNIATSEQAHMDAIHAVLVNYGMVIPVGASEIGVFTDSELQSLYEQFIARGSQSLAEAFKVGGAIEEIDILDLQNLLSQIDNVDIQQVFNNLLQASNNHLCAFADALLSQVGETYQPQYLRAEVYLGIMNASEDQIGEGRKGAGRGYRGGR